MDQERWNKQQNLKYGCFRREGFLIVMAVLGLLLCSCGKKEQETGKLYHVYSLNNDETAIASHEYRTETTDQEALIQELLEQLSTPADRLQYRAPLSGNVQLLSESVTEEQLLLDFLKHRPEKLEVILTGRDPSPALIDACDYVSEIRKIKHPFDKGLPARKGIEK